MKDFRKSMAFLPHGVVDEGVSLHVCVYSGASIPCNLILIEFISKLSPSMTFTIYEGDFISAELADNVLIRGIIKVNINIIYGVYIFDNFLFIVRLSV